MSRYPIAWGECSSCSGQLKIFLACVRVEGVLKPSFVIIDCKLKIQSASWRIVGAIEHKLVPIVQRIECKLAELVM